MVRPDPRFVFLWASTLIASLGFHLLTARLPIYAAQVGADDLAVGLLTGLLAAVALVGRPTVGWWMDRGVGAAALFAGLILFAVTVLGYWWASTIAALLAFRAISGIAVSLHGTANQTLAAHLVPVRRRGELLSVFAVAGTTAQGTAPAIGVGIARTAGDGTLFACAFGLYVLALVVAWPLHDVKSPAATAPAPARPPRGIINPAVLVPGLLMMTIMATLGVNVGLLPLHAGRRGLENPGNVFIAASVGLLIAQSFVGRLSDRHGRMAVVGPGLLVAALGMLSTSIVSGAWLYLAVALSGIGLGTCQPALQALAADLVPPGERGTAMGTLGVFHELGVVVGAVGGGLIGREWGLGTTYFITGLVAIAGAAAAFTLKRAKAFPAAAGDLSG
jgi:MFS family permease